MPKSFKTDKKFLRSFSSRNRLKIVSHLINHWKKLDYFIIVIMMNKAQNFGDEVQKLNNLFCFVSEIGWPKWVKSFHRKSKAAKSLHLSFLKSWTQKSPKVLVLPPPLHFPKTQCVISNFFVSKFPFHFTQKFQNLTFSKMNCFV